MERQVAAASHVAVIDRMPPDASNHHDIYQHSDEGELDKHRTGANILRNQKRQIHHCVQCGKLQRRDLPRANEDAVTVLTEGFSSTN